MNNFLVNEVIENLYIEASSNQKIFGIYPGRFQPPGPHHFKTFQWMESKFGKGNVFVATSNVTDPTKSPLSFDEKKSIWMKYGVNPDRIVQVKNPYMASEILNVLPEGSVIVFGYGKKDTERFSVGKKKDGSPSYLQWYDDNKNNLEDHTKRGYLIITPHFSVKVGGTEMSGTEIRNLIASDPSAETFKNIFGWYDKKIHDLLVKKFKFSETLSEGGHMFDAEMSMVRGKNADDVIKQVLKQNGLGNVPFSKIGNYQKPLLGDIDIAIDTNDILKHLGLPPTATKDELFDALKINMPNAVLSKGLYQFHLQGEAKKQPFINPDGTEENKPALVQVDVMLGIRKWRERWYSGAPTSEYKAKFRNMFIAEIVSKIVEDVGIQGLKQKHMITPAEGFFLQKFTMDAKGKKKEVSRELKSDDIDFVAKFLFGDNASWADIDTFEKAYTMFKGERFKFPEKRDEIISAFKQTLDQTKKSEPDVKLPKLTEKQHIQRFSGPSEMTDSEFLTFLQKVQPLVKQGKLDLSVEDRASITEKLDGSSCSWGANDRGQFYLESANSGPITILEVERFNNPFTFHYYETLKFLSSYEPFQLRLKKAFESSGPFKVTAELFPVLTHKGDAFGDIVFCSTRYNRRLLGEKGTFVCFNSEPDVLSTLVAPNDPMWKVYDINTHGRLPAQGLVFDLKGISDLVDDPVKLRQAITLIGTRGKAQAAERDALKQVITKVRPQLQAVLNRYAEKINTFLSNPSNGKSYPVEGVVLKVKAPDGEDLFLKGTSEIFSKIAAKTWGPRKEAGNVEKVFDGKFLTDVLGLSTSNPASLNKAVANAKAKVGYNGDDVSKNKVAMEVYQQLKGSVELDPKELKTKALKSLQDAAQQLRTIQNGWDSSRGELDPDTVDKTNKQLDFLSNRLRTIATAIKAPKYQGIDYIIYLLRLFIDKRMGGTEENV